MLAVLALFALAAYFAVPRFLKGAPVGVPRAPASMRDSGDRLRAALGDPADRSAATRVLHHALEQALQQSGLPAEDLRGREKRSHAGPPEWEIAVPGGVPLLQLNLAITRGVERAGGAVLDGYTEGDGVWLVVGTSAEALHRVFLASSGEDGEILPSSPRRVALVLEDEGNAPASVIQRFRQLGVPLTVAVLPGSAAARAAAERARDAGAEILLHLPLEPKGYPRVDPGRDAILVDLKEGEIRRRMARHLRSLPPVAGVSSYMGSLATQDRRVMSIVLDEVKKRGLFFLDSRTTPSSVALEEARRMEVPCLVNGVFLDDGEGDEAWIRERLDEATRIATSRGRVIITGHARSATAAALEKALPELRRQGLEFVRASALIAEREGAIP